MTYKVTPLFLYYDRIGQITMLTDKQEKFVQLLITGKSQREAYREAYGCKGWQGNSIDVQASRLFAKPKIQLRYSELHQKAIDKGADDAAEMRKNLIESHKRILAVNPLDYYEEGLSKNGNRILKPKVDLDGIDTWAIKDVRTNQYGQVIGYTFYEKDRALDALERLYQLNKEEVNDKGIIFELKDELKEYAE